MLKLCLVAKIAKGEWQYSYMKMFVFIESGEKKQRLKGLFWKKRTHVAATSTLVWAKATDTLLLAILNGIADRMKHLFGRGPWNIGKMLMVCTVGIWQLTDDELRKYSCPCLYWRLVGKAVMSVRQIYGW